MKVLLSLTLAATLAVLSGLPRAATVAVHAMPTVRGLLNQGGAR